MSDATTTTHPPPDGPQQPEDEGGRQSAPAEDSWQARLARQGRAVLSQSYLFVVLALIVVIGTLASPFFLTVQNFNAVFVTAAVFSVLAVGQFLVIVTAGIDLSVGSTAAVSAVVVAMMLTNGTSAGLAVVGALAAAGVIGLINGALVVYAGITPFIVTLAMLTVARGVAFVLQTGRYIPIRNDTFNSLFVGEIGPLQSPIIIAIVVMLIGAAMMALTPFGRRLYSIGGNAEAARLSGLPVKRDLLAAYTLCSLCAGLAGVMIAAQLGEGSAIIGEGWELNAIAAVVVGGASLFGGVGNPIGAVAGGLVVGLILNIMDLLGIRSEAQLIVRGAVIVIAVFLTTGHGRQLLPKLAARFNRRDAATSDDQATS